MDGARGCGARLSDPHGRWEFQDKFRASADLTLDADASAVGFENLAGGGQAKSGAFGFCRVERFEHSHSGRSVHAASGVDHVDGHAAWDDIGSDQ